MRWKRTSYALHRWMGLVISLQLLAWSVGGFMFSILEIENVRGNVDRKSASPPAVAFESIALSPAEAAARANDRGIAMEDVTSVTLRMRRYPGGGICPRAVYEMFNDKAQPVCSVDALSGEVTIQLSADDAKAIALDDFAHDASVGSVRLLTGDPPSEFRGGEMPVYQVILNHPKNPHLYISPVTGSVLKRRNGSWRIFDFFWMLHIMDYGEREDFNHPLLTISSALAILTSTSGLWLWWWRVPRRRRSR